jgi:catechol 2,3-dioxygenase-like lactoylglutathione lyase family enzyme
MKPRIDVITLAVADFDRALAFYRALGLESSGVTATEHRGDDTHPAGAIVMFHLGGQILALYPRSELAKDAGISPGPGRSGEIQPWSYRANSEGGRCATSQSQSGGSTRN